MYLPRRDGYRGWRMKDRSVLHPPHPISIHPNNIIGLDSEVRCDFVRHQITPFTKALHWLKLNHVDYYDCEISEKNLASNPEDGPPVVVDYYPSSSNKILSPQV